MLTIVLVGRGARRVRVARRGPHAAVADGIARHGLTPRSHWRLPDRVRVPLARTLHDADVHVDARRQRSACGWSAAVAVAVLSSMLVPGMALLAGVATLLAGPVALASRARGASVAFAAALPGALEQVAAELPRRRHRRRGGRPPRARRQPGRRRPAARARAHAARARSERRTRRVAGGARRARGAGRRRARSRWRPPWEDARPTRSTVWRRRFVTASTRSAEAHALSAQSRMSAIVVGAAPIGYLAFSGLVDPGSASALVGTGVGRVCLALGLGLEGLAALWIRRIVRSEMRWCRSWSRSRCSASRGARGRHASRTAARRRVGRRPSALRHRRGPPPPSSALAPGAPSPGSPLRSRARRNRSGRACHRLRSAAVGGRRRADAALARELPVAIDLLGVAVGAGCTPYLAVEVASRWSSAPVAARSTTCSGSVRARARLRGCARRRRARRTPRLRPLGRRAARLRSPRRAGRSRARPAGRRGPRRAPSTRRGPRPPRPRAAPVPPHLPRAARVRAAHGGARPRRRARPPVTRRCRSRFPRFPDPDPRGGCAHVRSVPRAAPRVVAGLRRAVKPASPPRSTHWSSWARSRSPRCSSPGRRGATRSRSCSTPWSRRSSRRERASAVPPRAAWGNPAPPVHAQRGQATVEFAFVLPLIVLAALAVIQVGLVVRDQLGVVHAAREAARAASVDPDPGRRCGPRTARCPAPTSTSALARRSAVRSASPSTTLGHRPAARRRAVPRSRSARDVGHAGGEVTARRRSVGDGQRGARTAGVSAS